MSFTKIYFIVATLLLLMGLGLCVYVWLTFQDLQRGTSLPTEVNTEAVTAPTSSEAPSEEVDSSSAEPVTLDIEQFTPAQQKLLSAFGVGSGEVMITAEMVLCAESAVGKGRIEEMVNGAAPTPLEAMKLAPCFKR